MANKDHRSILNKGFTDWNAWREQNPSIKPDLSGMDLSELVFPRFANFRDANMTGVNLSGIDVEESDFSGAILKEANLSKSKGRPDFGNANLQNANLEGCVFKYPSFYEADLRGANLKKLLMDHGRFDNADLRGLDFSSLNLAHSNFSNANLTGASLNFSILAETVFKHTILHKSKLISAQFFRADLTNADLKGSNLFNAFFKETILEGTDFTNCLVNATSFSDTDLSVANGLDKMQHYGPSHIDIDTVYLSKGNISHDFLSGAGIPQNFINHINSFTIQPIEFYSCFISYSSIDQPFAERIHTDLKNKGVRCWFAPEDMKGGQKSYQQIDKAIRFHDKLLLVLSKNSINSEWVKTEILRSRKAELKQNRQKLFPIRLIDMETLKAWECFDADTGRDLAVEVREYHIPDFSNWKDYDSYQKEFEKLLRDLNSEKQLD